MIVTKEMGKVLSDTSMSSPVYLDVKKEPFVLNGFCEPFIRVPHDIAAATSESVLRLSKMSAGGRVRFRTNSDYIVVHADIEYEEYNVKNPVLASSGFDIFFRENGKHFFKGVFAPSQEYGKPYRESRLRFGNDMKEVVVFFPRMSHISSMYIGLHEGAEIDFPSEYTYKEPVVFYGSSIVHGEGASRPSTSYPAIISRRIDCDFVNLGFAGAARAEKPIMEYIARLPMSVFVYDYDHNAPDVEYLKKTHYEGYRIFREKQPDTPVIMASKPDYHFENLNPFLTSYVEENEKRRRIIEEDYLRGVSEGDKNLYFVDGSKIYPEELRDECTADGCHPNDMGYSYMATYIGEKVKLALDKLKK
ncbi:MAG: SGNH/GDSL hydrolase family protein [Eubacteriales bacterium]